MEHQETKQLQLIEDLNDLSTHSLNDDLIIWHFPPQSATTLSHHRRKAFNSQLQSPYEYDHLIPFKVANKHTESVWNNSDNQL